jgi:hypothetical protein
VEQRAVDMVADPVAPLPPATDRPQIPAAATSVMRHRAARLALPETLRRDAGLIVVALGACMAAGYWILAAAGTAWHGLDVSDEGFYLLSYRWWDDNLQTFSGAQYVYGPLFELFGYDIGLLRLFRLFTVIAVHAVFGWSFMRWLRLRRPDAPESRWWEVSGTALVLASGGMIYCWLPLTPGYNDLSVLCALLATAVVLAIAVRVDRGTAIPAWLPAALGPVIVVTTLAKWASSVLTLGAIAIVALITVWPLGWRAIARLVGWSGVGTVAAVALIHVAAVPLTEALPKMLATNRLVAGATNSPLTLLDMYARTGLDLVGVIARRHTLLLIAVPVAVLARGRRLRWFAVGLVGVGAAASAWRLWVDGALAGGTVNLTRFSVGVILVIALAVLVGLAVLLDRRRGIEVPSLRRERKRGWVMLGLLLLLPILQALGTGNPLYFMAVNGFAAWVAVGIAIATGIESAPVAARALTGVAVAGAVLLTALIAKDSLWSHPYRTEPRYLTTTTVEGADGLGSIRLDPATAAAYTDLRRQLDPYIDPPGRPMMAFDEMAGIVLLLDGRPVGEAWYSAIDPVRTATGIRTSCAEGRDWWAGRAPVLLFRRPISDIERSALRDCGLDFANYRLLADPAQTMGLQVFVPAGPDQEGQE